MVFSGVLPGKSRGPSSEDGRGWTSVRSSVLDGPRLTLRDETESSRRKMWNIRSRQFQSDTRKIFNMFCESCSTHVSPGSSLRVSY